MTGLYPCAWLDCKRMIKYGVYCPECQVKDTWMRERKRTLRLIQRLKYGR
jgi:hypothetical protein